MHACPPTHPACCRGWGRGSARRSAPSAACRPGTPAAPTCTGGTAWRHGGLQRHNPPIPALTAELYVCPSEPQTGAGRAAWHGLQPPCCLILAGRATLSPDSKCVPPCPPPPPLPLPVLQLLAADADGALRALRHAHLVPAALHLLARVLGAVLSWRARQGGRLGAPRECSCARLRLPGAGPGPRSPLQPAPTPPAPYLHPGAARPPSSGCSRPAGTAQGGAVHADAARGVRRTQAGTARARTLHVHGYRAQLGAAHTGVVHAQVQSTLAHRTRPGIARRTRAHAEAPHIHLLAARARGHRATHTRRTPVHSARARGTRPCTTHTLTRGHARRTPPRAAHGHPRVAQSAARHGPAHRPAHLHLLRRGAGRRRNKAERR